MVYQLDSYRYWQEQLHRDDFEYGQFGENLTVEGLPDNEVCIGDRYRIGSALFEVTQPRVTCYRVGIRMANPQMPSLLVSHKRPGFYFRVLEEGEISAGDEIVKVAEGPERVTVAEVDALLYLPGRPHEQLQRALRIPALSPGWKASLQALAAEEGTGQAGQCRTHFNLSPACVARLPAAPGRGHPARVRRCAFLRPGIRGSRPITLAPGRAIPGFQTPTGSQRSPCPAQLFHVRGRRAPAPTASA